MPTLELQLRAPWAPWAGTEWGTVAMGATWVELADHAAQALCDGQLIELPGCPWPLVDGYTMQPECLAIDAAAEGVVQCLRWLAEFEVSTDAATLARIELPMPYGIELRLVLA